MPLSARLAITLFVLVLAGRFATAQPQTPEQQAQLVLVAARNANASGDAGGAAQRYQEILQKFPSTLAAKQAKYALALLAFNDPNADYAKVAESLTALHSAWDLPEHAEAIYYTAAALRMLGLKELEKAAANPAEAQKFKSAADAKFEEARNKFEQAREAISKKDAEWEGRCRCDKAEMSIRLNKPKDARTICEVFAKDPEHSKLKIRPLGMYYLGLACYLDGDMKNAGRTLNQLAPFADPVIGLHARYLVGRVLHLGGESAEASVHYEAVLAEFEKAKLAAIESVKQPDKFKSNTLEFARLRTLAQGALPEYVAGAAFHGASLSYEAGRFPDALAKFQLFAKAYPADALAPDAALRIGFCQVQQKSNEEAIKTLQPLVDKTPRLADQAQFWLGKAQFALAVASDPAKPQEREARTKQAIETLKAAIAKANQLPAQNDADLKLRKAEMLLELADSLHAAKSYGECVQIYKQLWNDRALPLRSEELLQRYAAALGANGEFDSSDENIGQFRKLYPSSTLLPAVLFRHAENAYGKAQLLVKQNTKPLDLRPRWEAAATKFHDVAEKYPEFERVNHARLGTGICLLQLGNIEEAVKALEAIPGPDRSGEVALAAYLLADCYIRQAPVKADDALQENQIREKLNAAAQMLESFTAGPKAPETPAALMKLGLCWKRLGGNLADANERNQTLAKARDVYARLSKEYPSDPLAGQAKLELAKVKAIQGDPNGAINDLRAFLQNDGTRNHTAAPLAALHLATLYRQQNNPAEAAKVLAEARPKYEAAMQNDPQRQDWVPLLKYHHAVAIFETGKPVEARPLFEQVGSATQGKPLGAEAALRVGQCLLVECRKILQDGNKARAEAGNNTPKRSAAEGVLGQGRAGLNGAAEGLMSQASTFKATLPNSEARARMYYDAAWAYRELAAEEIASARDAAKKELLKKLAAEAASKLPPNSPEPVTQLPEIDRSKIPRTKSEIKALDCYARLIEEYPETSLAVDARFETGEWQADRGEHAEAVKSLRAALDAEPNDKPVPPDTIERIRLRLGASLFQMKEYKAAASLFEANLSNAKSPYYPQSVYRAGECWFAAGEYEKAAARLALFRDKNEFHNAAGLGDRAMLRLGFALIAAKNPDAGKQALETMLQRFGNSPFASEARYALGGILQGQGKHDEAIRAYEQVVGATKAEVAAKAQLQIGECRMLQKKFAEAANDFLTVVYTYDYQEIANAASLEAARAYAGDGKPEQAERLLQKLMDANPADSPWHKAAKERLEKLPKK